MIAGIPIAVCLGYPRFWVVLLLMIPMVFDGFLQLLTKYESGNYRRLFTGILFGVALIFCFIYFHRTCMEIAGNIWKLFGADPAKIDWAVERLS